MLAEANRIIGEGKSYFQRKSKKRGGVWLFWGGALCGAVMMALILMIFGV